jgi:hypothetical protein
MNAGRYKILCSARNKIDEIIYWHHDIPIEVLLFVKGVILDRAVHQNNHCMLILRLSNLSKFFLFLYF